VEEKEFEGLLRLLPPVARGDRVSLPRQDYDQVRNAAPSLISDLREARRLLGELGALLAGTYDQRELNALESRIGAFLRGDRERSEP
jgi:hypothetical protein